VNNDGVVDMAYAFVDAWQNSQILRRPQDDKDGVVDMAYAFVDAWQNSQILRRPQDDNDGGDPSEVSG
jgi:hypothetical protein